MRYHLGELVPESDANVLFDVLKFMNLAEDSGSAELHKVALRMARHALEPLLNKLQLADVDRKWARDAMLRGEK
jgi:hypothetical protein